VQGRLRGPVTHALSALALLVAACDAAPGQARPGRAARELIPVDFDADSAHALIARQVAFGPRVPGTEGHAAQLAWMVETLEGLADTVEVQRFTHAALSGDSVEMANVFARFLPDERDRILLVAHWDTRPMAEADPDSTRRDEPIPGANDGGSGVAVLMEIARVLSSHSPPLGVDLLFTDGEDYGPGEMYLGATHFAANPPPGYRPLYGILVDLVADRSPVFPVEAQSELYAPEVVDLVYRTAREIGMGRYFPEVTGSSVEDDHIPLNRAGFRTIDIIDMDFPHWHTHGDALENTSPEGLEAVGEVLTQLVLSGG
jgi:Zn-dependent M28 family amino/carboxypeptidase